MKWRKPSQQLVDTFQKLDPGPPAQMRQMFGYPAAFVNGNMFMGLHEENMIVRLPENTRSELMDKGGRAFEPMPGRPMREYVVVPSSVLSDENALMRWVKKAFEYGLSLPPKTAKKQAGPTLRRKNTSVGTAPTKKR